MPTVNHRFSRYGILNAAVVFSHFMGSLYSLGLHDFISEHLSCIISFCCVDKSVMWLQDINLVLEKVQNHAPYVAKVMLLPWVIQVVNAALGYRLNIFGILPRHIFGLVGVFLSPLLHGSFTHIFMNSFFFFSLALIVLAKGVAVFWTVTFFVTVISGLIVWVIGRPALHVGASGLVVGYWSYTCTLAYLNPTLIHVIGAAVGMFYFGVDLLASLLPQGNKVSVEGHLAGFIAGVIVAYYLPYFLLFSQSFF